MNQQSRIVLTGFMGVGKSTVARHLAHILQAERLDLDKFTEISERRSVAEIIEAEGVARFRDIETENLRKALSTTRAPIIALGGGTWTLERNRDLIKFYDCTSVWLESTFEQCWRNISVSKQKRPLAGDQQAARRLFDERQKFYCLADWHFIVKPQMTFFEIARRISEDVLA